MPRRPAAGFVNLIDSSKAGRVAGMDAVASRGPSRLTTEWLESPYVRRLIRRVAREHGLAGEDLAELLQETCIALWKEGLSTHVTAGWILRTASHKAVDLVRSGIRRRAQDSQAAGVAPSHAAPDAELEHLLHARVDELPTRLREFYELHYHQGFSEREIAQSLGLCRASVRWLDRCCLRYITGEGSTRTILSAPASSGHARHPAPASQPAPDAGSADRGTPAGLGHPGPPPCAPHPSP